MKHFIEFKYCLFDFRIFTKHILTYMNECTFYVCMNYCTFDIYKAANYELLNVYFDYSLEIVIFV